jgi:hypothetical protein
VERRGSGVRALGIIGNLDTIKKYSQLLPPVLNAAYLVGQCSLIVSILIAIFIYRQTNKQLALLEEARKLSHLQIGHALVTLAEVLSKHSDQPLDKVAKPALAKESRHPVDAVNDFNVALYSWRKHLATTQQLCSPSGIYSLALFYYQYGSNRIVSCNTLAFRPWPVLSVDRVPPRRSPLWMAPRQRSSTPAGDGGRLLEC